MHFRVESADFKVNTKFKNIKVHVHDENIVSFLRLWKLDKFGDDLKGFRKTIIAVKNTQKPLTAIEVGRAGLVLRGISPVIESGKYLGSVEFMQGLNSIIRDGKKKNIDLLILMKKEFLSIATQIKDNPELNSQYVLASKKEDMNKDFFDELKGQDISKSGVSSKYFYTSTEIKDYSGEVVAYAVVGQDLKYVNAIISKAKSTLMNQVIIMVMLDIFLLALLIFILHRTVIKPIKQLGSIAKDISEGDGDLSKRIQMNSNDELSYVASCFNQFINSVQSIVREVIAGTHTTSNTINNLREVAQLIENDSIQTNNHLQASSLEISEVTSFTENAVNNIQQNLNQIRQANGLMAEANKTVSSLKDKVQQNANAESAISNKLDNLATDVEKINGILDVIKSVSEQTNLLALNAAIEAARAGEQGRGFAVVADEVRGLAVRTQKSLEEVNVTVSAVINQIQEINSEMKIGVSELSELIDISNNVSLQITSNSEILDVSTQSFEDNMQNISKINDKVATINGYISSIKDISTNNTARVESMTASFAQTSAQVEVLDSVVNRFKV